MSRIKRIFTNWKVLLLIFFLIASLVAIHPSPGNDGVTIRSVIKDSAAYDAGLKSPDPRTPPISKEKIIAINNVEIKNEHDYFSYVSKLTPNQTITIKTDKAVYPVKTVASRDNEFLAADLGITVTNAPKTNLREGLDLQGGTRVLLEPQEKLSPEDMSSLIDNMKQRLNVYGLSDLVIREVTDRSLGGETKSYILVEIAGATQEEVKDLLAKQGKFEARIGNKSVFVGGEDIKDVCRRAECSGLDPRYGCQPAVDGYQCRFAFSITLSTGAAEKQADITQDLAVNYDGQTGEGYLNETLDLYLDNSLVDSLRISEDLRGRAVTDIQISGGGSGRTAQEAQQDALANMKKLQTVLITGSLPVKLEVVKIDTLSPALGDQFLSSISLIGLLAILGVAVVIFIRYRRLEVSAPIVVIMIAEIILILGVAALIGWNLDLAAIAGILVTLGTGVDDQIVITDETLKGGVSTNMNWKQKLKKAFFIIFVAYAATVFAMAPLLFAGAGLLKGFALTTILGVTIGVFVTRPAYAEISEILLTK